MQIFQWEPVELRNLHRAILGILSDLHYIPDWYVRRNKTSLQDNIPWLPYDAIRYLDFLLTKDMRVFEYGSGGSTVWISQRVNILHSVEHDITWHNSVYEALRNQGINNCTLTLIPPERHTHDDPSDLPYYSARCEGNFKKYVQSITAFPDESFDVVIIDGRCRPACLTHAIPKVRPGGYLILDDSNRERYQIAVRRLDSWFRKDFWGIRPHYFFANASTTFWRKPENRAKGL